MPIIGQSDLLAHFRVMAKMCNTPRVIMLMGQVGQGKKTIAHEISRINNWNVYADAHTMGDIRNLIEHASQLITPTVYLFTDVDLLTNLSQSALLKVLEEPPPFANFILTTSNPGGVFTTIRSRAPIYVLEEYKKEELWEYCGDEEQALIFDNVGQLERVAKLDWGQLVKLSQSIVDNIDLINTANSLNIINHFNDEDADLLIYLLQREFLSKMIRAAKSEDVLGRDKFLERLTTISVAKQLLNNKSCKKSTVLEMMFLRLKGEVS